MAQIFGIQILLMIHPQPNADFYSVWTRFLCIFRGYFIDPFHVTGFFRYPMETSENLWFSDVFQGVLKETSSMN